MYKQHIDHAYRWWVNIGLSGHSSFTVSALEDESLSFLELGIIVRLVECGLGNGGNGFTPSRLFVGAVSQKERHLEEVFAALLNLANRKYISYEPEESSGWENLTIDEYRQGVIHDYLSRLEK